MSLEDAGISITPATFQAETGVSRETMTALETYAVSLESWNRTVNLVGRRTIPDLWQRHMLDSAQLASLIPEGNPSQRRIVDLGSGAGFPGLVLAIMGLGKVHLIEATQRKARFLNAVIEGTGANAEVYTRRIEDMPAIEADLVTARALAPLTALLGYARKFCGSDTLCLFPKGRKAAQELTEARKAWNISVTEYPSRSDSEATVLAVHGFRPR